MAWICPLPCVSIHFLPSVGVNNNDIQLALCNDLLTQQGPGIEWLIKNMQECVSVCVCVCACVCDGNVKCHTEVAALRLLS